MAGDARDKNFQWIMLFNFALAVTVVTIYFWPRSFSFRCRSNGQVVQLDVWASHLKSGEDVEKLGAFLAACNPGTLKIDE